MKGKFPEQARLDPNVAHPAAMYDYYLGGKDNRQVDRDRADQALQAIPEARSVARENRKFLVRAVEYLARDCGIRQIIDVGTGYPTSPNIHEVARSHIADSRIVYIDNDPVVVIHNRALRATAGGVVGTWGDLRDPEGIVNNDDLNSMIDWSEPVALMCIAVFHFVPPEDDERIVRVFRERMAPGSYLVASAATTDDNDPDVVAEWTAAYERASARFTWRTASQIEGLFAGMGMELVGPGLTRMPYWTPHEPRVLKKRPEGDTWFLAGVGRKA